MSAGTLYHFRAAATNRNGITYGPDTSFVTLSTSASLAALVLSSGPFTPAFDAALTNYTASVPNPTNSVRVTPTSADTNATLQVRVNGGTFDSVLSGAASPPLLLNVGDNSIDVKVTAQDLATVKTYAVALTRAGTPPSVTTQPATDIGGTSATLNGTINPNGSPTTAWFEWGATTNYGNLTSVTDLGSGATPLALSASVGGLSAGTLYHFRAAATNRSGITYGPDTSFVTLSTNANLAALVLSSGPFTPAFDPNTTSYSASLTNILAFAATATTADANAAIQMRTNAGPWSPVASGIPSSLFSLAPGLTTLQVLVTAQDGVTTRTYTLALSLTIIGPIVTTLWATAVTSNSATLNGTINPDGASTLAWFAWGVTTNYGNTTAPASVGSGTMDVPVSSTLSGISGSATYHYRMSAANTAFTNNGADVAFSTPNTNILVTTTLDTGPGSLRDAIALANVIPGLDTILLATNAVYTFTNADNWWYGPNALPPIASDITIEGNGSTIQCDTNAIYLGGPNPRLRFFYVGADPSSPWTTNYNSPGAGRLTLRNLTLRYGLAKGGDSHGGGGGAGMGGAIFNQGIVSLVSVALIGNGAVGGGTFQFDHGNPYGGGGMGQDGSVTNGGGFGGSVLPPGSHGSTNGGGGGFATSDNATNPLGGGPENGLGGFFAWWGSLGDGGNGSGGGGYGGVGGDFGWGGGTGAGGGVGGGGGGGGLGGGGGGFGGGGGESAFGNQNVGGGGGGFGGGGGGNISQGGGGGGGGFGGGSGFGGGGGAGMGGAVFNHNGSVTITGSTLAWNSATGGVALNGDGGSGLGGAIFNLNGTVLVQGSTLESNVVANGSTGGSALYNLAYDGYLARTATVTLASATLANNSGATDLALDTPPTLGPVPVELYNHGSAVLIVSGPSIVQTLTNNGGTVIGGAPPFIAGVTANLTAVSNALGVTYSADLHSAINPNGTYTTGFFQYGLSTAYGGSTLPTNLVASFTNTPTGIGATVSNLSPGFTYHFRAYATNDSGATAGPDLAVAFPPLNSPGDLNGDSVVGQSDLDIFLANYNNGVVDQATLNTILSNYWPSSPWLAITNPAGLGRTNVTFALTNASAWNFSVLMSTNLTDWDYLGPATPRYEFLDTNAPAMPQRYYRLRWP